MAVTTGQIHDRLKEILAELRSLGGPTVVLRRSQNVTVDFTATNSILSSILTELLDQGVRLDLLATEVTQLSLETELLSIDTSLDNIEADADAIRLSSIDIENNTDGIETLITASNVQLVAIEGNTDDIESKLDTIDNSVQDVEGNTGILGFNSIANIAAAATLINIEGEVDNLEEQAEQRFQYQLDTEFTVTSVAGGTVIHVTIQPASGNSIRRISIRFTASVLTDSAPIVMQIRDGTGGSAIVNRDLVTASVASAGLSVTWPIRVSQNEAEMDDVVINAETIHLDITLVDVDDVYAISIRAQCKESSGTPVVSTSLSTATITTVETRNTVVSA